jgi:hypothetical protein
VVSGEPMTYRSKIDRWPLLASCMKQTTMRARGSHEKLPAEFEECTLLGLSITKSEGSDTHSFSQMDESVG